MIQAASSENMPRNKTAEEGGSRSKDVQKTGNKKGGDKIKEKSRDQDSQEKDAKSQQMAQPWRGGADGDKIRVQSRHVKQH